MSSLLTLLNPATEQIIAELPHATAADADAAIAKAAAAGEAWRKVTPVDLSLIHI